jgi:hypothetical protein
MKRLTAVFAMALMLTTGTSVGAGDAHPVNRYSFWNAHREDAGDLSAWSGVYTFTGVTCEQAVEMTLIGAYRDGWQIDTIDPPFAVIVRAFPDTSPCSATLGMR